MDKSGTFHIVKVARDRFLKSGMLRSAGVLISGTVGAQLLTILSLPILTRLYSPADFGVLAAFMAVSGTISVVACLRLEIAIPIAADDADASRLSILAFASATVVATLVGLVAVSYGERLANIANLPELAPYVWLLPVSVWLAGFYAATQYWATRREHYGRIAGSRIAQAVLGLGAQIGLGLMKSGAVGLVAGQALLSGIGALNLMRSWREDGVMSHLREGPKPFRDTFVRFRRFPLFSTFEAFANRGAADLPVLLIAAYAIGPEAGFLLLAIKVMGAPISLVGNALTQIFLGDARAHYERGNLAKLTSNTVILLAKIGAGPIIFVAIIAPLAFEVFFGAEWGRSGTIVGWMTAWSFFKLLTSPISGVMHVQMKQVAMSALQIGGFVLRVTSTLYVAIYAPAVMVETFAVTSGIFYGICLIYYCRVAGVRFKTIAKAVPLISAIASIWILAAFGLLAVTGN